MSIYVGPILPISEAFVQGGFLIVTSMVNAFTPSALSTILLCAAKDKSKGYATIYAALRRHLSTSHTERHYNEGHTYQLEPIDNQITYRHVCGPFSFHPTACSMPSAHAASYVRSIVLPYSQIFRKFATMARNPLMLHLTVRHSCV